MADRYPHFWGGSQICTQSEPPVKATNGKKLKMLNCKFACISDPAANTMQTAVTHNVTKLKFKLKKYYHLVQPFYTDIAISAISL